MAPLSRFGCSICVKCNIHYMTLPLRPGKGATQILLVLEFFTFSKSSKPWGNLIQILNSIQ